MKRASRSSSAAALIETPLQGDSLEVVAGWLCGEG